MIEKLETFVNVNGFPIIRRCFNCKHWYSEQKGEIKFRYPDEPQEKLEGSCTFKPMYFSSTLQPTVYPITKEYYLCENHEFEKEEYLNSVAQKMLLKDAIKSNNQIKK